MMHLLKMGVGPLSQRMGREGKMNPSWSVILRLLERQQRSLETDLHGRPHLRASQSNTSHLGQKGRLPTEMLSCSVCLLWLFPGLATLQEDLDQR